MKSIFRKILGQQSLPQIGFEILPVVQRYIVERAHKKGVSVCVATQFLDELAQKKHLCAAELNDVFLATRQKVDSIMLAGEVGGSPNSGLCLEVINKMIEYNTLMKGEEIRMCNDMTEIMATMGPTLQTIDDAKKMISLGVKEYRIHMGLRTRDFCSYFRNVRIASKELGQPVRVLLDLPSSRPRVAATEEHLFSEGECSYIFDNEVIDRPDIYAIPLPKLSAFLKMVSVGDRVMFRDGHVVFEITKIEDAKASVICKKSDIPVKTPGSCNFPDSDIEFDPIDSVDISYMEKMRDEGLVPDMVALSFAATTRQIQIVRDILKQIWPEIHIEIICKIESRQGVKNIDQLIDAADGIMVARGDLLLCVDPFMLPQIQLEIVQKCNRASKYVCVATEFFSRFAATGIVNRSELSDVALAVREGSDSIMLAQETGNSKFCFEGVKLIKKIIDVECEHG